MAQKFKNRSRYQARLPPFLSTNFFAWQLYFIFSKARQLVKTLKKILKKIKKPTRTKSRNSEDEEKKSRNYTLENIKLRKVLEKFQKSFRKVLENIFKNFLMQEGSKDSGTDIRKENLKYKKLISEKFQRYQTSTLERKSIVGHFRTEKSTLKIITL